MLKKTMLVAATVAALGVAAAPAHAGNRYDDRVAAGAVIGGVTGAIIGNSVDYGGGGAIVGGVLGAVTGAALASGPYYGGYYYGPRYYAPAYVVRPAPVYYAPRGVYYRPAPVYRYGHRHDGWHR